MTAVPDRTEDLLRELAPRVLGTVARKYRDFDTAEDAVQEALVAASRQWPAEGVPDSPEGWLVAVASRRLINIWRADAARRRREESDYLSTAWPTPWAQTAAPADERGGADRDDTLRLLFLCCHPALSSTSAIALTLRAVGGLSTAEIAAAFLVPESTMAQRIHRAKQRIAEQGLVAPDHATWRSRLDSVLRVLYLVFNEGYASHSPDQLIRVDLSSEAIRLTRALRRSLPGEPEVAGLLALLLLTDARRLARVGPYGELVPLPQQDRQLWDYAAIAEGTALIDATLRQGCVGPYQVQAAIAALHDEARTAEQTDWPQILALYGVLERVAPNPVVTLNRAVALAMVEGARAGLALLSTVEEALAGSHRLAAVRGHLLALAGDVPAAVAALRSAADRAPSRAEQRYLLTEIARLANVAAPARELGHQAGEGHGHRGGQPAAHDRAAGENVGGWVQDGADRDTSDRRQHAEPPVDPG